METQKSFKTNCSSFGKNSTFVPNVVVPSLNKMTGKTSETKQSALAYNT